MMAGSKQVECWLSPVEKQQQKLHELLEKDAGDRAHISCVSIAVGHLFEHPIINRATIAMSVPNQDLVVNIIVRWHKYNGEPLTSPDYRVILPSAACSTSLEVATAFANMLAWGTTRAREILEDWFASQNSSTFVSKT